MENQIMKIITIEDEEYITNISTNKLFNRLIGFSVKSFEYIKFYQKYKICLVERLKVLNNEFNIIDVSDIEFILNTNLINVDESNLHDFQRFCNIYFDISKKMYKKTDKNNLWH